MKEINFVRLVFQIVFFGYFCYCLKSKRMNEELIENGGGGEKKEKGWIQKNIVQPVKSVLSTGITPHKLALSIAFGICGGLVKFFLFDLIIFLFFLLFFLISLQFLVSYPWNNNSCLSCVYILCSSESSYCSRLIISFFILIFFSFLFFSFLFFSLLFSSFLFFFFSRKKVRI